MQIKPEQLAAQLAKGLRPIYTIHGDEPLLAQEAGDAIRAAARCSPSAARISIGAQCWARRRR
jgi:DNA polymerase III subunit delta